MAEHREEGVFGGYDHHFVDPTEEYVCPLCLLVARSPIQTECGHSFCSSCWTNHVGAAKDHVLCPVDKNEIDVTVPAFNDRKQDRAILSLKVYCSNRDNGCPEVLELRDLQMHDEVCPMKSVECGFCQEKDIIRKYLDDHQKTMCPLFKTFCNYALVGCTEKVERQALKAHHTDQMQQHLSLVNSSLSKLYDNVGANQSIPENDNYELPQNLWGKVAVDDDLEDVPWSELAGWDYSRKAGKKNECCDSLRDKVQKLERINKALTEKVDTLIENAQKVQKLEKMNTGLTEKVTELLKLIEQPNRKVSNNELEEGACYMLPFSWTKKVNGRSSSPMFYTIEGYKVNFVSMSVPEEPLYRLGLLLCQGKNDDELTWPWNGAPMCLTVSDSDTNEVLGQSQDVFKLGQACPTKTGTCGNGYFLYYRELSDDIEGTVVTMTMSKSTN